MTLFSLPLLIALSILLFSLLQSPTFATEKSYIVYLGDHPHGPNPTSLDLQRATASHYSLLASFVGSYEKARDKIFYSYTNHINGFAAVLEQEEAAEIAKNPNVISVFPNRGRKLHTTRSWNFLGLERDGGVIPKGSIWNKARFGEDTIIANLDTGVWPESKSFSDQGMGPVPSKWRGICQLQRLSKDHKPACNRKLIGARYFNKGYASVAGPLNSTFQTARDNEGHGSHTLSTAAGSFVPGASIFGYGNGTAKGGAPKARVAAYKVCWPPINGNECFDADILAGFDAAISDGVHVLSVSLGGDPSEFFNDGISIGSFHAVKKGVVVVASAGNSGPSPGTVSNVSPWILTVGASTMDREFTSFVQLGNKKRFRGASLSSSALPSGKFYPLITGEGAKAPLAPAQDAILCKPETLDAKKVKGKILVCLRGDNPRVDKGHQAQLAGAVAMILANDAQSGNEILADAHILPASHINFTDGVALYHYINSTKSAVGYISGVKTELRTKPAPFMASFSSRGPNMIEDSLLKPDITAPGVSIIAAYTEASGPTGQDYDKRRIPFNVESGTSMSCPHVAGIVGLLKTLHPDWSPAAIRSAIMTTAKTHDNVKNPMLDSSPNLKATPFAYGSGQVQSNRAMDPGLVYDLSNNDYLNFLCARGYNETNIRLFAGKHYKCPKTFSLLDFNYPSITVPRLSGSVTVSRTVKNVGPPGTYYARVKKPAGVFVSVKPGSLKFNKTGESQKFKVTLRPDKVVGELNKYTYGQLTWSDGKRYVRSPLVVKRD